ncbi:PatA/PatG family cyanobactin maturation protease [Amycolatopsis lurida]
MCEVSRIPGLARLWERTRGDDRIRVAIVDGPVDNGHPAFAGVRLTRLNGVWPEDVDFSGAKAAHGTLVASVLFGRHGGPVTGVAPGCRGVSVPVFSDRRPKTSQLELARGIELAVEAGAQVINVSGGQLSPSGEAEDPLARAVRFCQERNVLVVAAAGNDGCFCAHVPAALPSVLAVGALDDAGRPMAMSNWGEPYARQGLLAPGENILGAVPDGGTARHTGTSLATPIVAGVAALLLSLQRRAGRQPDPLGVGAALLATADPCELADPGECVRFLSGKLNVEKAVKVVTTEQIEVRGELDEAARKEPCGSGCDGTPVLSAAVGEVTTCCAAPAEAATPVPEPTLSVPGPVPSAVSEAASAVSDEVVVSAEDTAERPWTPLVYAVGVLGFDFGTEARRDSFKQLMGPVAVDGTVVPANPYDARQMVDHLKAYPSEAKALIWTLNLELTPIYAIEPAGAYAADVYELLTRLLTGEVAAEDDTEYIERIALPGKLSGRTVKLFSGQVVPVVEVEQRRGLYGWEVNRLTTAAVEAADNLPGDVDREAVSKSLREFLTRVYYDLRNLGATSRDRALNFAATNAFQATHTLSHALAEGMALDTIGVEKSPFCRMDSDCWDVKLRFFDPENSRRARRVYRFTIDVSDILPVTLGEVRSWAES